MPWSPDAGVDYVQNVTQEITNLKEGLCALKDTVSELRESLALHGKSREADVNSLHERLSRENAVQTQMRAVLEKRTADLEGRLQQTLGKLDGDVLGAKERIAKLEESAAELVNGQREAKQRVDGLAADSFGRAEGEAAGLRLGALEAAVARDRMEAAATMREVSTEATRASQAVGIEASARASRLATTVDALSQRFSVLQTQQDVDRGAAVMAAEEALANAMQEVRLVKDGLATVDQQSASDLRALSLDMSRQGSKLQSLDTMVATLAKEADLQALALRVQEEETATKWLREEMAARATTSAMAVLSDRVTTFGKEAKQDTIAAELVQQKLSSDIEKLSMASAKTIRQREDDRELFLSCCVALEKRVADTPTKSESAKLESRLADAEAVLKPLPETVAARATKDFVSTLSGRLTALEADIMRKAETSVVARLELTVADRTVRQETMQQQALALGVRTDQIAGAAENQRAKLQELRERTEELEASILNKTDRNDVLTKESVETLLSAFYRKDEIDLQFNKVAWCVAAADAAKPPKVVVPLSARK